MPSFTFSLTRDDTLEKLVIEKIAIECGQNYVKKITSMFTDIQKEDEVETEDFREVFSL